MNLSLSKNLTIKNVLLIFAASDYLTGKMEAPENYDLYQPAGDFNMAG